MVLVFRRNADLPGAFFNLDSYLPRGPEALFEVALVPIPLRAQRLTPRDEDKDLSVIGHGKQRRALREARAVLEKKRVTQRAETMKPFL